MFGLIAIIVVVVGAIIFYILTVDDPELGRIYKSSKTSKENHKEIMKEFDGVKTKFESNRDSVCLDKESEQIRIIYYDGKNEYQESQYKIRQIKFKDIISSEVVVDDQTIVSSMRGSQLTGAAVGGLLFGGLGGVVGGLSGKKKHDNLVSNIQIKLTINDIENPIAIINFLQDMDEIYQEPTKKKFETKDEKYIKSAKEVEKWQGIFDVILKQQTSEITN